MREHTKKSYAQFITGKQPLGFHDKCQQKINKEGL